LQLLFFYFLLCKFDLFGCARAPTFEFCSFELPALSNLIDTLASIERDLSTPRRQDTAPVS